MAWIGASSINLSPGCCQYFGICPAQHICPRVHCAVTLRAISSSQIAIYTYIVSNKEGSPFTSSTLAELSFKRRWRVNEVAGGTGGCYMLWGSNIESLLPRRSNCLLPCSQLHLCFALKSTLWTMACSENGSMRVHCPIGECRGGGTLCPNVMQVALAADSLSA